MLLSLKASPLLFAQDLRRKKSRRVIGGCPFCENRLTRMRYPGSLINLSAGNSAAALRAATLLRVTRLLSLSHL